MNIAIDFDDTITADFELFRVLINLALLKEHDVRIVTFRDEDYGNTDIEYFVNSLDSPIDVIYTSGNLKAPFCATQLHWYPDIWMDDNPHWIGTKDKV